MWVCKDHQDIEVNSKGKGCPRCQRDIEASRERKAAKRRRRDEDDSDEERED